MNDDNYPGMDQGTSSVPAQPAPGGATPPTIDQWRRLYEAAAEIKRVAPWDNLWDCDLITIMLKGNDEPVCCSVMGRNGECYAIGVYAGYESIMSYYHLVEALDNTPPYIACFEQKCLMCYFGDREEVTPVDRNIYNELNIKFRGRNAWVYFRNLDPGFHPWYIDTEQADLLISVYEQLLAAYADYINNKLAVDFDGGETIVRRYVPEQDAYVTAVETMPQIEIKTASLVIGNELLIASLKRQKFNKRVLEMDIMFLPIPIQENKLERPYTPRFIMLADRNSGLILDQHMAEPEEDIDGTVINMVIRYIESFGRPAVIYVRNDRSGRYIYDLCGKTGIKTVVGDELSAIDNIVEELLDMM